MVRRSDRYLADQYLRKERHTRVPAAWLEGSDPQDTAIAWERHYAEMHLKHE